MKRLRGILVCAGLVVATASASAAQPTFIVRFEGAEIGPAKSSSLPWDGPPTRGTKKAMGAAALAVVSLKTGDVLLGKAASKITSELSGLVTDFLNQPDPHGKVTLRIDGEDVLTKKLPKQTDTYSPQWGKVTFRGVDLDRATLRVRLAEWDAIKDDPIGVCEIRSKSLKEAAKKDGIAWVFCGDQTENHVLFVRLSIEKQGPDTGGEGHEHP